MFHSAHMRMSSNRTGPNMNNSPVGGSDENPAKSSAPVLKAHPTCEEIRDKGIRVVGASVGVHNGGKCYRHGEYIAVFEEHSTCVHWRKLVDGKYKNLTVSINNID